MSTDHLNRMKGAAPPHHDKSQQPQKRRQTAPRQAYDFNSSMLTWLDTRNFILTSHHLPALFPREEDAKDILPQWATRSNPATGVCTKFMTQIRNKNDTNICSVRWEPNGHRIVTGCENGDIALWNGFSFNFENNTPGEGIGCITAMEHTRNGNFLLTGHKNGGLYYWEPTMRNANSKPLSPHTNSITSISFSPTDLRLATSSRDRKIAILDFEREHVITHFSGHTGHVTQASWHRLQSLVVSGSKDGTIRLWDPRQNPQQAQFSSQLSPTDGMNDSSGQNPSNQPPTSLGEHSGSLCTIKVSNKAEVTQCQWGINNHWFATTTNDGCCRIYDVRKLKPFFELKMNDIEGAHVSTGLSGISKQSFISLTWHPIHEQNLTVGSDTGSIYHLNTRTTQPIGHINQAHSSTGYASNNPNGGHLNESKVTQLHWHPLGHILLSSGSDSHVRFWVQNIPGDPMVDKYNAAQLSSQEQNAALQSLTQALQSGTKTVYEAQYEANKQRRLQQLREQQQQQQQQQQSGEIGPEPDGGVMGELDDINNGTKFGPRMHQGRLHRNNDQNNDNADNNRSYNNNNNNNNNRKGQNKRQYNNNRDGQQGHNQQNRDQYRQFGTSKYLMPNIDMNAIDQVESSAASGSKQQPDDGSANQGPSERNAAGDGQNQLGRRFQDERHYTQQPQPQNFPPHNPQPPHNQPPPNAPMAMAMTMTTAMSSNPMPPNQPPPSMNPNMSNPNMPPHQQNQPPTMPPSNMPPPNMQPQFNRGPANQPVMGQINPPLTMHNPNQMPPQNRYSGPPHGPPQGGPPQGPPPGWNPNMPPNQQPHMGQGPQIQPYNMNMNRGPGNPTGPPPGSYSGPPGPNMGGPGPQMGNYNPNIGPMSGNMGPGGPMGGNPNMNRPSGPGPGGMPPNQPGFNPNQPNMGQNRPLGPPGPQGPPGGLPGPSGPPGQQQPPVMNIGMKKRSGFFG